MTRFHLCGNYLKTVACVFLFLPACASPQARTPQNSDSGIEAIQQEHRQVISDQIASSKTLEDIYERLNALDAKLDFLETRVQDVADRPNTTGMLAQPQSPTTVQGQDQKANLASPAAKPKEITEIKKTSKKPQAPTKNNVQDQYDKAYATYTDQRYDEALSLFKNFIQQFPQHDLADNAQYWIGEIHYDMENYQGALLAFEEVTKKYADQNKAPDALLKIGYCYMALDDPNNAQLFFKRVIKNYPFSEAEAKAREKLKEIEHL
jgi:tol-pal system protein YbgF